MTKEISNTKKLIKKLWIATAILVLLIVFVYVLNFSKNGVSKNPENWGQFGDFFGGTLNAILSIINFIVLSFLTLKIVEIEESRNSKILAESVKPVAVFEFEIGVDELKIDLYNAGLGPLFIKELVIFSPITNITYKDFKEVIDSVKFEKYRPNYIASRSNETIIRKDQANNLLHIDLQKDSDMSISIQERRENLKILKSELSSLRLRLFYTDMYKNEMETIEDELSEITIDCS